MIHLKNSSPKVAWIEIGIRTINSRIYIPQAKSISKQINSIPEIQAVSKKTLIINPQLLALKSSNQCLLLFSKTSKPTTEISLKTYLTTMKFWEGRLMKNSNKSKCLRKSSFKMQKPSALSKIQYRVWYLNWVLKIKAIRSWWKNILNKKSKWLT